MVSSLKRDQNSDGGTRPLESRPDTINLLDYFDLLVRNKRLILASGLAAFVLSASASLLMTNIYTSTALILPPQNSSGALGMLMGQLPGSMSSIAGDLLGKGGMSSDVYVRMLTSDAISDAIIDRFKLMELYKQKFRLDTYKVLSRNVSITSGKKDGVVSIMVDDKDPKRAADIANAYVEELDKLSVGLDTTDAGHDAAFLEKRLAKAKVDLANAEDAIKAFQSANKTIDVTEQAKGTIKGVGELEGLLAIEEGKLAGMKSVFRDGSEEVKAELAVIANLRGQIAKFEGKRSGSAIPGVGSVPNLGEQYLRLLREFKIQEALVELLTKQYEVTKLTQAKQASGVQVIQRARVADQKSKPHRAIIVLGSTFATVCAAIFYAFLSDYTKRMPTAERDRCKRILAAAIRLRSEPVE